MSTSKDRSRLVLPDVDPSVALAEAARRDMERESLARRPSVQQLMEQAKRERAEFMAAGGRRFAARLKSLLRPAPKSAVDTTGPVR